MQKKMDPWQSQTDNPDVVKDAQPGCENKFADSFMDVKDNGASEEPADSLKKLADTDKYLNKLYGRLSRLQQAPSSRQLISSLQSGREDQFARLLRTDVPAASEGPASGEPVEVGYLQRRLLPHTVPLSSDELLQLLKEDQLQRQADQQHGEGEQ